MGSRGRRAHLALVVAGCVAVSACGGDAGDRADTGALAGTQPGAVGGMTQGELRANLVQVHESEIEAGNLAQERATNAEVRQFAQRMVNEHTTLLRRTREQMGDTTGAAGGQQQKAGETAAAPGAQTPGAQAGAGEHTADPALTRMHQDAMQRLRNLQRGAAFDREYINSQVAAHEAALERLDRALGGASGTTTAAGGTGATAAGGQQPPAAGGQPTGAAGQQQLLQELRQGVQAHLEEARRIQQQLGGGGS